ncbi:hypothetical protein MNBD_GAMMA12-3042 [hydrothermal vent metagenome]|uniref:Flagellar assembly protein FliH/Type III secretion system HrpE domain-containing protein n=1 Tax=hydrothermal vent metagenome TaxID=652676 RepID=A0A3B0YU88_9ZZZZ
MSKIISKDEAHEFEAWDIPLVEAGAGVQNTGDKGLKKYLNAAQLEEIYKQAFQEAWKQGQQQGLEAGEKLVQDKVQTLGKLFNALASPLQELDGTVEAELVDLVIVLLKQLVRRELKLEPGQVVAVVKDALRALPLSARNIQVRLNPEDLRLVEDALGSPTENQHWQLIDDPVISRGGCKVVTNTSQIDSTVESQVASLIAQVFGDQRNSDETVNKQD